MLTPHVLTPLCSWQIELQRSLRHRQRSFHLVEPSLITSSMSPGPVRTKCAMLAIRYMLLPTATCCCLVIKHPLLLYCCALQCLLCMGALLDLCRSTYVGCARTTALHNNALAAHLGRTCIAAILGASTKHTRLHRRCTSTAWGRSTHQNRATNHSCTRHAQANSRVANKLVRNSGALLRCLLCVSVQWMHGRIPLAQWGNPRDS